MNATDKAEASPGSAGGGRQEGSSTGRGRKLILWLAVALGVLGLLVAAEANTSILQSYFLHRLAARFTWTIDSGPNPRFRVPTAGPYDLRRGYTQLAKLVSSLADHGYQISSQARLSARAERWIDQGFYPVYAEKTQAGLRILDRDGRPLYADAFPERVYQSYDSIPAVAVNSLLYLENRALMSERFPDRNPAVEWDRLVKAALDYAVNRIGFHRPQAGGSTLATQIEKFRHSPEGRTESPRDKLRQMLEASLRAYLDSRNTLGARRKIILDYMNSVPLAARPDYGEVQGLKDGLWVWFNDSPEEVDRLLRTSDDSGPAVTAARGRAFREVLALFIAQRRPSDYLLGAHTGLDREIDGNLRLLGRAQIISPELRDAALRARLTFRRDTVNRIRPSFAEAKATTALRSRLLDLTGMKSFYDLDRCDLTVTSTIDRETQRRVTRTLNRLRDPAYAESLSLRGAQLLEKGSPAGVIYSFDLFERTLAGNVLRVQADNLDQPLDINEGVKLELGSTAKLRTLCNYLQIIGDLHAQYAGRPRAEILRRAQEADDPIRRWACDFLASGTDTSLSAMLNASVNRSYSSNPREKFYTGGGLHTFENFKHEEDGRSYSVRDGLVYSVNLVYVRLMRDIVHYYRAEIPADSAGIMGMRTGPLRQEYLSRFADKEGKQFLWEFYKKYRGKNPDEQLSILVAGIQPTPKRLAVIWRTVHPEADFREFAAFLRKSLPAGAPGADVEEHLFDEYAPGSFDLADLGYLARLHPLELWLLQYLAHHPKPTWDEITQASNRQRQEVYSWLFRSGRKAAQDKRIRDILEEEAFDRIHDAWARLGYPFEHLVPSYATAIGSSADKPAALADLMGIIVNAGWHYPLQRLERLQFAEGTPYETVAETAGRARERVMRPEAARVVRGALLDVVEKGTAVRAKGSFRLPDGRVIPVGGKTGTGDNRFETFDHAGRTLTSKVINRTATFVFLIGDRFFGTVTAHVNGPDAAGYVFTSALSAQLMRVLAPDLLPLVARPAPAIPATE